MLVEGQTIGNYRVLRKLGEGGMGAVFEAQHVEIGRKAAIKVLHPQFAQNAQVAMRFLNEAKAANLIEHPGVVEIFEFSRLPDGTTYIVMEFLKGESLAKRLERGPIGLDALRIARQIGSVLVAAHEHGIIHRELKHRREAQKILSLKCRQRRKAREKSAGWILSAASRHHGSQGTSPGC